MINGQFFSVDYSGYDGRVKDLADAVTTQANAQGGRARVIMNAGAKRLEITLWGSDAFRCAYRAALEAWFDKLD